MAKILPFKAPMGRTTLKFLRELSDAFGIPVHTISMPSLKDGDQLRSRIMDAVSGYPMGTRGMFILDSYDRALASVQEAATALIRGDEPALGNWCIVQLNYQGPEPRAV